MLSTRPVTRPHPATSPAYHPLGPCGYDSHGLPTGVQIIGRPFDEPGVLRIGSVFEAATDFANRAPIGL